jgi:nucleoside 2-deoxyribosyltransferase
LDRKIKVYLAVPIVNYYNRELTLVLGEILEELGFEITSPWVLSGKDIDLPPENIFERDIGKVKVSDILLAEISSPSHGVGMEVMQAYISNKKIIMIARKDSILSSLLVGVPNATIIRYKDYEDLRGKLRKILKEVER